MPILRSIVRKGSISPNLLTELLAGFSAPTEAKIIREPEDSPDDEAMTGANLPMLKYAAARALATTEEPTLEFEGDGGAEGHGYHDRDREDEEQGDEEGQDQPHSRSSPANRL